MAPRLSATFLALALALPSFTLAGFDPTILDAATMVKARQGLIDSATHSWELGTATEALLEQEWKDLSVYNPGVFPLPDTLSGDYAGDVLDIAKLVVSRMGPDDVVLIDGDGAAGDPASLGMAVLLTDWTLADKTNHTFAIAAEKQINHVLVDVPRHTNGGISHRESQVQFWADCVYMIPPTLAFAGAIQNNATLLRESYNQIKAYREVLADESGLWQHILLGDWSDQKHWNTGNGWAAAGMMRVLKTIKHSSLSSQFIKEQADLAIWTTELARAAWSHQGPNGTLFNVIDDDTTFADATGTAMMASATYRLATLTGDYSLIPFADKAFDLIKNSIDEQGHLTNAVNPLDFYAPLLPGQVTPEGQAFILMLQAAKVEFLKKIGKRDHHQRRMQHHSF